MSMIVARMQKMKADNLIGSGNHNQRKTKNHSNFDIDTSLSNLNYDLVNSTEYYKLDILKFINETKTTTRSLRKDAVLINEWIISSDKSFFDDLTKNEIRNFFQAAIDYFAEKFGEDNIRYATVHLDESTPHMHMGIVPFDDDNKLSAKRVFNREALRDVQEDLPKYLQFLRFKIERGKEGSERKNLTVPEFKKLKKIQKEINREVEIKKNELLAYTKEIEIDKTFAVKVLKEIKEVEVESYEKNLFGKSKMKKVKKWTGNIILSKEDYIKLNKNIKNGIKAEKKLNQILDTDFYKENKNLKNELEEKEIEINKEIDDYNRLVREHNDLDEENKSLKLEISDLRKEIKVIYITTKDFLKSYTSDLEAYKTIFKNFVQSIFNSTKNYNLDSNFKKEFDFDKENKIKSNEKTGFDLEDLKRRADERNQSNKKENTNTKSRGRSR